MATLLTSYDMGESNDMKMGEAEEEEEGDGEKAREVFVSTESAVQRQDRAPSFYFKADKEIYCYAGHEITITSSLDTYAGMIWPAALALCRYLETHQKQPSLWDKAVLEIGAGTGLVSIVAALLGAWVTATDLEDTLSHLGWNLSRNTTGRCRYTPQVAALPWGYDVESSYPKAVYNYDYVLATDVVYHHDYLDELLATMKHFCGPGTTLIWANQIRFQTDLTFTERFKKTFHTELLAEDGEMKIFMATCREGVTEDNLVEETQVRLHEEQRKEEEKEVEREEGMEEKEERASAGREENREYCVEVKDLGQNLLTNDIEKCPECLHRVSTAETMADGAVPNILNEDRTENNSKQAQERIDDKEQDEVEDECSQASVQNLDPEEERCKDTETENSVSTCGTLTNQEEDTGSAKDKEQVAKLPWAPIFYTTFGNDVYYYVGEKINIHESIDSYGAVMWPAALALCHYLDNNRQKVNLMAMKVLELGAGTGLVTIVASLLGASATATDLPDVLGNLKLNVMRNTHRCRYTPQVSVLSWGYDLESTHPKSSHHYDYVLAADVVYHHDYLDELLATMKHFCQPGTTLIWANKVRYEADLTFTEKFKKAFHTELLAEDGEMKIFMATCREGETEDNLVEETQGRLHEEQREEEEEEGEREEEMGEKEKERESAGGEENREYCVKEVKELGQNLLTNDIEKCPDPEEECCKNTETENNVSTCGTLTNQDEDTGSAKDKEQVAKLPWAPIFYTTFGNDVYYYVGEKINIHESIDSYGAVMWPAALALCHYLDNNRQKVNLMAMKVLELGAGTGLVTIVASLLGASATATDLPDVFGNLKLNVMRNTHRCRYTPQVSVLSWGYDLESTHPKSSHHYDYVLAADVVYHHDYLDELLATMKHFCQPGTTLIWANKVRYEADLTFTEKFKKAFHTELLAEDGEMKIFMATCREGETEDNLVEETQGRLHEEQREEEEEEGEGEEEMGEKEKDRDEDNDSTCGTLTKQDEDTGRAAKDTEQMATAVQHQSKPVWAPTVHSRWGNDIYYYVGEKITIHESIDSYGAVMWPAALALCYNLDNNSWQDVDLMGKEVLELGAGTGLVTIVASLLGARVTATDLPDVLSNLRDNVTRNTRGRCKYTPEVSVLSWGYNLERTYPKSAYHYDYVLAADVVYHHDYLDELLATMKHFCQPGTTLIWANKVRFCTDLDFTEKFKKAFHTALLFEDGEMKIFMATYRELKATSGIRFRNTWDFH